MDQLNGPATLSLGELPWHHVNRKFLALRGRSGQKEENLLPTTEYLYV